MAETACMKKRKKALRRKLHLEWAEESFGLPVLFQPLQADSVSVSATEFLRRQASCTGNPLLHCHTPEAMP
jgi:hypothetical protein